MQREMSEMRELGKLGNLSRGKRDGASPRISKNRSIKARIIITFMILVFVPFILFAILAFLFFQRYVIREQREAAYNTLNVVGNQIVEAMKSCEQKSMEFYYGDYLDWLEEGHVLQESERAQLQNKLNSIAQTDSLVYSVVLRLSDGSVLCGGFYPGIDLDKYAPIVQEGGGQCYWFGSEMGQKAYRNTYVMARSLNSEKQKNVASIYYIYYENVITDSLNQLNDAYRYHFLTDEDGRVYQASDESILQDARALELSVTDGKTELSSRIVSIRGKRYFLAAKRLGSYHWYCVSLIALDDLIFGVNRMLTPFFAIVLLYLLFLALMIRLLQKYVFHPLQELKRNMDAYAVNDLQAIAMPETGTGEFRSLSRHFNHMVERIESLMNQYKQETEEKNRLQMTMLASQLVPHFIYNSLNTLKWLAVLNHQDKIREVTESLIYIFMSASKTEDADYTLRDELELVKNYGVIQQVRFMNFQLRIEVCPEAEDCHIRKLLLQPIVENAIVHGLGRGKIKNTEIVIKIWLDENLHMEVRDFGLGFDLEKWRQEGEKRQNHTNVGIHHVEELIRMEYGEPYYMHIQSQRGEGTLVSYLLPILRKDRCEASEERGEGRDDTNDHSR